ncbi:prolipoprotein diacylglyceryl transferase [Mediannikoviicoccus vaginalis]|uniref:prolipoprotein diacylglyceryl transferase n=1 Tax=Mediannikoviicoccus vaginalis TaxID=2899727 RepID=UPI001EFF8ADB|nr:prolipoprotein diacylglyceryl transferase [Mediannikoviicoccus vaginalis]
MEFNINPVAFSIFGIDIMWYAILITTGIILGLYFVSKLADYKNLDKEMPSDLLLWVLVPAILGARLYYVIFSWDYYSKNPSEIIMIRNGGLAIYGGLLTAFLITYIYSKKKKIPFLTILDIFAPGIALGQAIGRWGNFINKEAYGRATDLPWAIIIDGQKVHPTFLYESLGDFVIFIVLYNLCKKNRNKEGTIISLYFILYGILRFFVEGLRTDSLYFLGMRVSQLVSLVLVVIGVVICIKNKKLNNK